MQEQVGYTDYPFGNLEINVGILGRLHLWVIRRLVGKRPVMLNIALRRGTPGVVSIGDSNGLAICNCGLLSGVEYSQAKEWPDA